MSSADEVRSPEERQSEKWRALYYRALDERDDERAEVARLREQLDAARQALQQIADTPVLRRYDGSDEDPRKVARAVLGVEGQPPREDKSLVSAAEERGAPDGNKEA